jgi:hypothetical protein
VSHLFPKLRWFKTGTRSWELHLESPGARLCVDADRRRWRIGWVGRRVDSFTHDGNVVLPVAYISKEAAMEELEKRFLSDLERMVVAQGEL